MHELVSFALHLSVAALEGTLLFCNKLLSVFYDQLQREKYSQSGNGEQKKETSFRQPVDNLSSTSQEPKEPYHLHSTGSQSPLDQDHEDSQNPYSTSSPSPPYEDQNDSQDLVERVE